MSKPKPSKKESQQPISLHQRIMHVAYDRWHNNPLSTGRTYTSFIAELCPIERLAVIIGNLNYQVNNGGWGQWHCNDYHKVIDEVTAALANIGTPAALETAKMAMDIVALYEKDYEWDSDEDHYMRATEDKLSKRYFIIADKLLRDTESYLRQRMRILRHIGEDVSIYKEA